MLIKQRMGFFFLFKNQNYGQLAGLKNVSKSKSRIKNDKYEKDNPQDFALWKFYDKDDGEIYWDTEIGGASGMAYRMFCNVYKMFGRKF